MRGWIAVAIVAAAALHVMGSAPDGDVTVQDQQQQSSASASLQPSYSLPAVVLLGMLAMCLTPQFQDFTRTVDGLNPLVVSRLWVEFLCAIAQNSVARRTRSSKVWPEKSVVIYCSSIRLPGERTEGWGPDLVRSGIGGSEEAVIYLSQELVKLGYEVTVFNRCGKFGGVHNGVTYEPLSAFNPEDEFCTVVAWRFPFMFHTPIKAKWSLYWMHDAPVLPMIESWVKHPLIGKVKHKWFNRIDRAVLLSNYQRANLEPLLSDMGRETMIMSRNGVASDDFCNPSAPLVARNPRRVIYSVCYSRGLEHLLAIWPEVLEEVPDAELHVFYGWSTVYDPEQRARLEGLMDQRSVYEHGRIGHRELVTEMRKSGIFAYPSHTPEAFSISTLKAQLCGCVPIVNDLGALKEVVKVGIVIPRYATRAEANRHFKTELVDMLKSTKKQEQMRARLEKVYGNGCSHTWETIAKEWDRDVLNAPVR